MKTTEVAGLKVLVPEGSGDMARLEQMRKDGAIDTGMEHRLHRPKPKRRRRRRGRRTK